MKVIRIDPDRLDELSLEDRAALADDLEALAEAVRFAASHHEPLENVDQLLVSLGLDPGDG